MVELNATHGLKDTGYHKFLKDTTGYFWISSNNGLLQVSEIGLNKSADKQRVITNLNWYGKKDGIYDPEFNGGSQNTGLIDERGNFWFTNLSGVVSFNPYKLSVNSIIDKKFKVQQVISSTEKHPLHERNAIKLEDRKDAVTLRFAHLSLTNNKTDDIWYRNAKNGTWQKPEEPGLITLTGLSPGINAIEFTQYPDRNKILGSFTITLKPYFYETALFQISLAIALILGSIMVIGFYKKNRESKITSPGSPVEKQERTNIHENTKLVNNVSS